MILRGKNKLRVVSRRGCIAVVSGKDGPHELEPRFRSFDRAAMVREKKRSPDGVETLSTHCQRFRKTKLKPSGNQVETPISRLCLEILWASAHRITKPVGRTQRGGRVQARDDNLQLLRVPQEMSQEIISGRWLSVEADN